MKFTVVLFGRGEALMMIDFYAMRDARVWDEGTWWDGGGMSEGEWAVVFNDSFGCLKGIDEPHVDGEPIGDWEQRVRNKFQSAVPDYPLLGRMWDIYGEYWYTPEEVEMLRAECRRASAKVSDVVAAGALTKLARACDLALSHEAGLMVAGD